MSGVGTAVYAARRWVAPTLLGLAGLWWSLSVLTGDALTLVRWANYATPWIGMGLLAGGAALLAVRSLKGGMAYLFAALVVLAPYGNQLMGGGARIDNPANADDVLRVFSFNLMTRNVDMEAVAGVILRNPADLIFLQEVRDQDRLSAHLAGLYGSGPTYMAREDRLNLTIISRFPLVEFTSEGKFQRTVLKAPHGDIFLRNLHAVKGIGNDTTQRKLLDDLADEISGVSDPVIVAGDFNMTQDSDGYRSLRVWLRSAHEAAGSGFGFTFPTPARGSGIFFPLLRIDHLFVSRHFEILSAETLSDYGSSDHFPIEAGLVLR